MRYAQDSNNPRVVKISTTIEPFTPTLLSEDYEAKPIEWLVDGLIPRGQAILFTGPTKLGKSFLCLDLMICASLGREWLGKRVDTCASLGMFCEDSTNMLFWRRDQILRYLGAHHYDTEGRAAAYGRPGMVNWLMEFDPRSHEGRTTRLWQQLTYYCETNEVSIVVLDTARQVFDGNEIVARQVTEFANVCNRLAEQLNAAVIVTHHPPKSGESEYAGSGAWPSTFRTHIHLSRPPNYNRETGEGAGEVILRTVGSNYGAPEADIPLRWDIDSQMLIVNRDAAAAKRNMSAVDKADLDARIMQAVYQLMKDNARIVADQASKQSLANRLRATAAFSTLSRETLQTACDRLTGSGQLVRVTIGKGISAVVVLRPPSARYANEEAAP